jgi:putative hydrolase of the HAD superfamily
MKTLFFDIGNVLVFFSHPKMFEQIATCTGLSRPFLQDLAAKTSILSDYETGKISTETLYADLLRLAAKPFTLPMFKQAVADIFTPNRDVWPLVEHLKAAGHRLILLSNTNECHFEFLLERFPILELFDSHVLSHKVGAAKPSPLIFKTALEQAEAPPADCFYIDDVPQFIAAAKEVGLDGEVFRGVAPLKQALQLRGVVS